MEFVDNITPSSSSQYYSDLTGGRAISRNGDNSWQARHDWATMYYQNAYNTALMNYMNEYNKPLNQMLRYQEAGISPWLVAGQANPGNMDSGHAGAAPKGSFTAPTSVQKQAAAVQTLQSINQVVGSAAEFYDAVRFGMPLHHQQMLNAKVQGDMYAAQARRYAADADWAEYWNYGPLYDDGTPRPVTPNAPRARYMEMSYQEKANHAAQLASLVDSLYPSQVAANDARAALQAYQKQILEGKNDAILTLDTGYPMLDMWLKMILMMGSNASFGFTGKMF